MKLDNHFIADSVCLAQLITGDFDLESSQGKKLAFFSSSTKAVNLVKNEFGNVAFVARSRNLRFIS